MFSPMSSGLSPEDLQRLMATSTSLPTVLLIDCRPGLDFNSGHIRSAHNVHCPPIVKRRSAGSLPLDNIIRCPKTRAKLLSGGYRSVVLYDEATADISHLVKDSNMYLVAKTLQQLTQVQELKFLEGGYGLFETKYPSLCSHWAMPVPTVDALCFWPCRTSTQSIELVREDASNTHANTSYKRSAGKDQGDPVQILPWLYIGNEFHASQSMRLRELGITAMLNVSKSAQPSPFQHMVFSYKSIPVEDNSVAEISCWFPEAIKYIEKVREKEEKVLVHCHAGISRSATICLAYLMYHLHCSLDQAYDYLKSKRKQIGPNLNFMRQLLEFENELRASAVVASGEKYSVQYSQCTVEVCEPEPCATPLKTSISLPTDLFAHSELGGLDLGTCGSPLRPSLSLPLTPCTKQAVFVFESSPHSPSPITMCHSPLVSPS